MISGIANSPIPDRENELISSDAMEAAIPAFMKIPILHVDHTERPVGGVTACRVLKKGDPVLNPNHRDFDIKAKEGDTYFKAYIPDDGDCDDVWDAIEKGRYKKISIYGVRTVASPECKLRPHERVSPCITKGIRLWSFSLVGDNAINPNSYIKIAKSFSENLCDEFEQKTNELIKAAFPDYSMAPIPDQDAQVPGSDDAGVTTQNDGVVMKAELDPVIQDVALIKIDMTEMKTGIAGIFDYIKKSTPVVATLDATEAPPVSDYITKATLEPVIDLIVKAKVELAVADIKKAYDAKFAEFAAQMDSFGRETIKKGGHVVVINQNGEASEEYSNPFLSNLDALGDN